MLRINLTLISLLLFSVGLSAKSFSSLSSKECVSVGFRAESEGYKNIHLLVVNKNKDYDSIPLKLEVVIGGEKMVDYHTLAETINEELKTVYLYEGDSITVNLFIQSSKEILLNKLKGNLKINDPMVLKSDASKNSKSFIGNYWDVKQTTIFRAEKFDTIPQIARFNVQFDKNYAFDKFHYQINVMSPDSSFYSVEGSQQVNKDSYITLEEKTFDLLQEVGISKSGKYIIEIVPLMGIQRINGVKSVGYQLVNVLD